MTSDRYDTLDQLGTTQGLPNSPEEAVLERVKNPCPEPYMVRLVAPEFTSICPVTGQPDFATLKLEYTPDEKCVELKSLKMYMWTFRERGAFHEAVTNEIIDHLVAATDPRWMKLTMKFNVRGGIYTDVVVEHNKK